MSEFSETPPLPELNPPTATESGLPPNIAAGLAELFSVIGGVVFYFIEKRNAFVRFHALQSAYLGALAVAISLLLPILLTILAAIPIIGWIVAIIIGIMIPVATIVYVVVWLIAVVQAFLGKEWEIPWIGKLARRHLAEGLFFYVKSPAL